MSNTTKKNRTVLLIVLGIIIVAAIVSAAIILPKIIKDGHNENNTTPIPSDRTPEASVSTENPSAAETESTTGTPSSRTPEPEVLVEIPKPDNPTEADDYFWETSKVYKVTNAMESDDVKSEKEAIAIFTERGFAQYPIEYDYSMDGKYLGDTEASESSSDKHPRYYTYYVSDNGDYFTIYLIEDSIVAFPISMLLDLKLSVEVLISDSDKVTSYNAAVNKFYLNRPTGTTATVKTIQRVDADSLNALTKEDLFK
jgi:hypothetical protein